MDRIKCDIIKEIRTIYEKKKQREVVKPYGLGPESAAAWAVEGLGPESAAAWEVEWLVPQSAAVWAVVW